MGVIDLRVKSLAVASQASPYRAWLNGQLAGLEISRLTELGCYLYQGGLGRCSNVSPGRDLVSLFQTGRRYSVRLSSHNSAFLTSFYRLDPYWGSIYALTASHLDIKWSPRLTGQGILTVCGECDQGQIAVVIGKWFTRQRSSSRDFRLVEIT
ncbi:hypothetical protein RRG08_029060 [Elysia crispata]|uniref:Uncharacterized protein n=1 Tax=Elysia crispata TaxID=231223 RepID=A0AAE1DIF7_9GAST|nr:hypothetical protein RRG08_029060 [Elysia crispata]